MCNKVAPQTLLLRSVIPFLIALLLVRRWRSNWEPWSEISSNLLTDEGALSPLGNVPARRSFKVVAIFSSGLADFDSSSRSPRYGRHNVCLGLEIWFR